MHWDSAWKVKCPMRDRECHSDREVDGVRRVFIRTAQGMAVPTPQEASGVADERNHEPHQQSGLVGMHARLRDSGC